MNAAVAVGIAAGCALAGKLSGSEVRFYLVRAGAAGVAGSCALITLIGFLGVPGRTAQWMLYPLFAILGVSSGLYAVPLQVFLQARPPAKLKGRMIGAMNFVNWVGILLAAGLYELGASLLKDGDPPAYHWLFAAAGGLMVPVAAFYKPADAHLGAAES